MYDNWGRCYQIYGDYYSKYYIDYDKGVITIEDEYEEAKMSFNSRGYITSITASWNSTNEYGTDKGNGKISFSYDGDGHLTSEDSYISGTEIEDGEKWNYTSTFKSVHTWKNGILVSTVSNYKDNENGDIETGEDRYTVEYGNVKNTTEQMTFAISNALDFDLFEPLAMIGLFGKGTTYLPTAVIESEVNYPINATYSINSNGTIKSENYLGTKSYTYVTLDAGNDTKKVQIKAPWADGAKKSRIKNLFVRNKTKK